LYKHYASKIAKHQINYLVTKLPCIMRKILLSALLLLCTSPCIWAQITKVCPSSTTPPADLCINACVYCDFNGLISTTAGYTGQNTNSGCVGTFENEQWLGFVANCNSVTFIAVPSNCTNGDGLQLAVYTDCNSAPIACYPGGASGNLLAIVTVATIPGQTYLLAVDGYAGDQCDFSLTVAPPTCAGAPFLMPTLPIQGPNRVCPGTQQVYSVPTVSGANSYVWNGPAGSLINGQAPPVTLTNGNMTQVTVTIPNTPTIGVHQICVQPMNACTEGTEMCKISVIKTVPPTLFSQANICPEDLPYITPWGQAISETGFYEATLGTPDGCDSILRQFVSVRPPIITALAPIIVCDGQTITVCGQNYGAGDHQAKCNSANGCDSTVIFSVISFPINTVTPVFGNLCGQGTYTYCGKTYTSPGIYLDSCQTGSECVVRYQLTLVDQPILLQVGSLVQPTGTSSNGSITMTATGGTGFYTYFWESGSGVALSTMSTVSQLPAGVYQCVVRDQAGCQSIIQVQLIATSGVNDVDMDPDFVLVQPNPAADFVTITSRKPGDAPIRLEISTADGRLIKSISRYVFGTEVSLVDLPKTALFFKLHLSNGQILTKKVLRQ
jgi:PKD-like domain